MNEELKKVGLYGNEFRSGWRYVLADESTVLEYRITCGVWGELKEGKVLGAILKVLENILWVYWNAGFLQVREGEYHIDTSLRSMILEVLGGCIVRCILI